MKKKRNIIVGMSGGVDSTVAVYLLQQQGYEVLGVTLQLADHFIEDHSKQYHVIERAKAVCERFGIQHIIADYTQQFDTCVVNYFADAYLNGNTPNPCVQCNHLLKWNALLRIADEHSIKHIATGHYAKIEKRAGRYHLLKGRDTVKDQSYFLWKLTQEQLSRTVFPLGDTTKTEIRSIAGKLKLPQADQAESQDVCFIPDNDYKEFLQSYFPERLNEIKKGNFTDKDGKILGQHDGYYRFTIGQRKGLGLAMGEPVYVREIHPDSNTVIIGKAMEMEDIGCIVSEINWIAFPELHEMKDALIKIRYRNIGIMCRIEPLKNGNYHVLFSQPVKAVTPGQSAVFYENDEVIGGGIIVSNAAEGRRNEKNH